MPFILHVSQTVDIVNHDVIIASGRLSNSSFQVKVGELQSDIFSNRHNDVPHALRVTFVVLGPELGLNHPRRLFGRKTAALDF